MHCHHEKTIVIDDRVAFVGGIDLTSESGDRYDTSDHPARGEHWLARRLRADRRAGSRATSPSTSGCGGTKSPARRSPRPVPARTRRRDRGTDRPHRSRAASTTPSRAATSASSSPTSARSRQPSVFIYLENQFLWSPEIAAVLADKLAEPPNPDFRMLLVLPSKPNTGVDDTRGVLGELIEADGDDGRLLACTLYARSGPLADPVYVHAKIGIVDDAWLTLGSANLNEHSLFNDTEMNLVAHDPDLATRTRLRLWAEHLELPIDADPGRSDRGDRRALEADQQRTARPPHRRPTAHAPARPPTECLEALRVALGRSAASSSTAKAARLR